MTQKPIIKALIVDDEDHARANLNGILMEHCPSVEVVGLASTVDIAARMINEFKPDVVFLDIKRR